MDTELMLDVGQANELKLAFRRSGWTNAEIKKLCEGNLLARLLPLVQDDGKNAIIQAEQHLIDCDADPFTPSVCTVESHKKGGQFAFDPAKIKLYFSPTQQGGKRIKGNKLRKDLANQPPLNANVLDFLIKNPHLIPEEWKRDASGNTRYIFFWGTIYRHSDGILCVRCLYWDGRSWHWSNGWLHGYWGGDFPAALLAS